MKKKIVGIFVIMLMISSAMTNILFSNNSKVEASGGEPQGGGVNLDYDWVWLQAQKFANVIRDVNWSENGENNIPKGRSWATAGENYTINEILEPNMNGTDKPCGLTGYTNLSIGFLPDCYEPGPGQRPKQYSSKIVIKDYNLTINSSSQLALDTIFNGKIRASDLTHGAGTYRVYVAFRDPKGNILKTNSGVELKAWWQFTKT